MQCPRVCIPMYVRDNTSMQCNVLMFAFQCVYATGLVIEVEVKKKYIFKKLLGETEKIRNLRLKPLLIGFL